MTRVEVRTGLPAVSPGGKSHLWLTPTRSGAAPRAQTISLAEGRRLAMRGESTAASLISKAGSSRPDPGSWSRNRPDAIPPRLRGAPRGLRHAGAGPARPTGQEGGPEGQQRRIRQPRALPRVPRVPRAQLSGA